MTEFITKSGAHYRVRDNKITRMSEVPMVNWANEHITDLLIEEPIIWIDEIRLGFPLRCTTGKGPLTTTPIKEIHRDD